MHPAHFPSQCLHTHRYIEYPLQAHDYKDTFLISSRILIPFFSLSRSSTTNQHHLFSSFSSYYNNPKCVYPLFASFF